MRENTVLALRATAFSPHDAVTTIFRLPPFEITALDMIRILRSVLIGLICSSLGLLTTQRAPMVCAADVTNAAAASDVNVDAQALPSADPTAVIDAMISAGWQSAGVQPSPVCDDAVFIRRIYLDLIGRIPTPAEQSEFLRDSDPDKRASWVDQLLASPAYARHMADVFDVMLLGRPKPRMRERRAKSAWRPYLEEAFATNRPWNRMARDIALARNTDQTDVRAAWFMYERRNSHQEIAEAVAPAFFGIRIECAQCHDHPLASEIQQGHYWGLVAFFDRSENKDTDQGPRVAETASGGAKKFTDLAGDSHDTLLTFFESPVVDEPGMTDGAEESEDDYVVVDPAEPRVPKFSRRRQFADQVLADHPLLSRAFVNRMWALLVGRGFVHPYDRMDSMHSPSHPELLDWLAADFRASGYDVKRLVRHIVAADCYQLVSQPVDENAQPEQFAFGLTKLLPAESLLRSVCTALQGTPAEPDPALMAEFCETFPDVLPEEPISNLSQALLLTNHARFNHLFEVSNSPVLSESVQLPNPSAQVERLFQAALGRQPGDEERTACEQFITAHADPKDGVAQLMWALLTSAEFRVNH